MAYIRAKDVVLLINNGTTYVPHVCAVSVSLKTTIDTVEVMTEGDGSWSKPRQQKGSYTLSFDGVTRYPRDLATGYDAFEFLENQCQYVNFEYHLVFYENNSSTVVKMIDGVALVIDSDLTAGADNLMDSSFTCAGFGAYQIYSSIVPCNATLATLTYDSQGPLFVTFNYTGLSLSDRLEYQIDSFLPRVALVDMPASGSFTITFGPGLVDGEHTINVWPVCANGEDGPPKTVIYTKT